jgi:hypothetical protein
MLGIAMDWGHISINCACCAPGLSTSCGNYDSDLESTLQEMLSEVQVLEVLFEDGIAEEAQSGWICWEAIGSGSYTDSIRLTQFPLLKPTLPRTCSLRY